MNKILTVILILLFIILGGEIAFWLTLPKQTQKQAVSLAAKNLPTPTLPAIPTQPIDDSWLKTDVDQRHNNTFGVIFSVQAAIQTVMNENNFKALTANGTALNFKTDTGTQYYTRNQKPGSLPIDTVEKKLYVMEPGRIYLLEWLASQNSTNSGIINLWRIMRKN